MCLVEGRSDSLSRHEWFVTSKSTAHRSIEGGSCKGVLQSRAEAKLLDAPHIQHHLQPSGLRAIEVDRHENAGDGDLVIFKSVAAVVHVPVNFQADPRVQLLRDAKFAVVLRVGS